MRNGTQKYSTLWGDREEWADGIRICTAVQGHSSSIRLLTRPSPTHTAAILPLTLQLPTASLKCSNDVPLKIFCSKIAAHAQEKSLAVGSKQDRRSSLCRCDQWHQKMLKSHQPVRSCHVGTFCYRWPIASSFCLFHPVYACSNAHTITTVHLSKTLVYARANAYTIVYHTRRTPNHYRANWSSNQVRLASPSFVYPWYTTHTYIQAVDFKSPCIRTYPLLKSGLYLFYCTSALISTCISALYNPWTSKFIQCISFLHRVHVECPFACMSQCITAYTIASHIQGGSQKLIRHIWLLLRVRNACFTCMPECIFCLYVEYTNTNIQAGNLFKIFHIHSSLVY